jgi:MFS transporter, AAHS family, 3-hydroxyphenylpropionic acid transporter
MVGIAETAGARSSSGSRLTIALCFAVMVIEGYDIQALGVAAPSLGKELGLAPAILGQALSAANIGLVFGAIAGGWLADLLGRKPVLIGAVAIFGVFTLMTMQSTSYDMLFYARLLTGLGFGGALPNVMAVSADLSDPSKRGSTAAMMFCGMPVGGSSVALLSWLQSGSTMVPSSLQVTADWRVLFLIGGVIPLVLAPVLLFFMKETQKPAREPASLAKALPWLAAIPFGVVFWLGLRELGVQPGFASIAVIAPWLGGVLGILAAYMIVHRGPLFGGNRALASIFLWVIFFPTLVILYMVLNWLPTLVAAKGFPTEASLASLIFNASSILGALVTGLFVDRLGVRWPLTLCFVGLVGVLLALGQATSLWPILILSGGVGFFLLGANYGLYGAGAAYYPGEMRGRGSGAAVAWGRLGAVAGPLVGGLLLQGGAAPGEVVYSMIPFAVVAAIGVLLLTFLARQQA